MSGKGKQSGGQQHRIGIITTVPGGQHAATTGYAKATTMKNSCMYSNNSNSQQVTFKSNTYDKQSCSYAKTTFQQSCSTGDVFKERSTGRVGFKDEFKTTSTRKVGDRTGYTEYQLLERVRHVDYGSGSSCKGGSGGSKKYLK